MSFGSEADMCSAARDVRFGAKSGLMQRSKCLTIRSPRRRTRSPIATPTNYPQNGSTSLNGLVEMINENGNHNDLPLDDPAFKWAWEIYKEGDHLVHNRTTFFFAAHSFLVVAYSTFAVSRFNWKEKKSIYIIAMGIIVFMVIIFSFFLWELNYTLTKRMKESLRDPYLER